MRVRAALSVTLALVACPSREDFVLVPDMRDPAATCVGDPEVLTLSFRVVWANGERAQPVTVAVGAHADLLDAATADFLEARILLDSDGDFDGTLDEGETVSVGYSGERSPPTSGCDALCGREVRILMLYAIDYEMSPVPPVPNTQVQSDPFVVDC